MLLKLFITPRPCPLMWISTTSCWLPTAQALIMHFHKVWCVYLFSIKIIQICSPCFLCMLMTFSSSILNREEYKFRSSSSSEKYSRVPILVFRYLPVPSKVLILFIESRLPRYFPPGFKIYVHFKIFPPLFRINVVKDLPFESKSNPAGNSGGKSSVRFSINKIAIQSFSFSPSGRNLYSFGWKINPCTSNPLAARYLE